MAVRDTKNSGSHNASRKYGVICRQEEACIARKMGVAEKGDHSKVIQCSLGTEAGALDLGELRERRSPSCIYSWPICFPH